MLEFTQRETARLLVAGEKSTAICRKLGIGTSTLRRWRHEQEFIDYAESLERECDKALIEHIGTDGVADFDAMQRLHALVPEAIVTVACILREGGGREVSAKIAASKLILDVTGHIPPARRQQASPRGPLRGADRLRELDGALVSMEGRTGGGTYTRNCGRR
jgi:hypothetical protein